MFFGVRVVGFGAGRVFMCVRLYVGAASFVGGAGRCWAVIVWCYGIFLIFANILILLWVVWPVLGRLEYMS